MPGGLVNVAAPAQSATRIWFLARFAGQHAMAQIVVIPILGFLFFNSAVSGLFSDSSDVFESVAVTSVATIVAWAFFTVMGFIINAAAPERSGVRAVAVAIVFGLTEVVRISAVYELATGDDFGDQFGIAFRLSGAFMTGLVLLGLASVAVGDYRDYREDYRRYVERLGRLVAVLGETQSHVELVRAQFGLSVRRLLTQNVTSAFTVGDGDDRNHSEVANKLFRIADEVVRPLSHSLSESAPTLPHFGRATQPPRVPLGTFFADVTSHAPFAPGSQSVIVALLTAPVLLVLNSMVALGLWVVFIALVFVANYGGYRFLTPVLTRIPIVLRILLITPLFSLPHVFFGVLAIVPGVEDEGPGTSVIAYLAVLGAILGWLPAIADGLKYARQRFITQLETVDADLARAQVRAQSQLWLDQKRLALALHSDVQGTILAAAMQLQRAVAAGGNEAERILPQVEQTIRKSLLLASGDTRVSKITSLVTGINKTWASLISLTVQTPKPVSAALNSDPLAMEVVCELIKELHINSFKHGRASECVMVLSLGDPSVLHLQMRNNGATVSEQKSLAGGLGESFITSVTLSYSAQNIPEGVQIDLDIPLGSAPEVAAPQGASASRV
jgi:signal transduction histidine kinase